MKHSKDIGCLCSRSLTKALHELEFVADLGRRLDENDTNRLQMGNMIKQISLIEVRRMIIEDPDIQQLKTTAQNVTVGNHYTEPARSHRR